MLAFGFGTLDDVLWTTGVPLGVGAAVASLVLGFSVIYGRWRRRRRRSDASQEEDLPWQALLSLLQQRNRDRAAAGLPPEQLTDEELGRLLASLPSVAAPRPLELPEDREFVLVGGEERRTGGRRWGNPTEVYLLSALWPGRLHGLVVNRSTGGLGIFADKEVSPSTRLRVRALEAPPHVPAVRAEVRYCLKIGKGFLLGCQFSEDVPWNARVWFG